MTWSLISEQEFLDVCREMIRHPKDIIFPDGGIEMYGSLRDIYIVFKRYHIIFKAKAEDYFYLELMLDMDAPRILDSSFTFDDPMELLSPEEYETLTKELWEQNRKQFEATAAAAKDCSTYARRVPAAPLSESELHEQLHVIFPRLLRGLLDGTKTLSLNLRQGVGCDTFRPARIEFSVDGWVFVPDYPIGQTPKSLENIIFIKNPSGLLLTSEFDPHRLNFVKMHFNEQETQALGDIIFGAKQEFIDKENDPILARYR